MEFNKAIDVADFCSEELVPFLREIARDDQVKFGLAEPLIIPDSKNWECAMMLRSFEKAGVLRENATFAGIGAGIEQTTYALAARGCVAFPVDRYLDLTPWSDVAPSGVMVDPAQYTNIAFERGRVIPVHSDCRHLSLPTGFFDGVYSAGSIEHVGSLDAVAATAEEIGRILRPGGLACLSTEFRLLGPNDRAWFDDNCILFTPELIQKYIVEPSGCELIDVPNFNPSQQTYDQQVVLLEFLERAKSIRTVEDKLNAFPNLTLFHEGFLFCSVHLALRKRSSSGSTRCAEKFEGEVQSNLARTSAVFARQFGEWNSGAASGQEIQRASYDAATIAVLEARIEQILSSRSMRLTRPLRALTNFVRRRPILRKMALRLLYAYRGLRN